MIGINQITLFDILVKCTRLPIGSTTSYKRLVRYLVFTVSSQVFSLSTMCKIFTALSLSDFFTSVSTFSAYSESSPPSDCCSPTDICCEQEQCCDQGSCDNMEQEKDKDCCKEEADDCCDKEKCCEEKKCG